MTQRGDVFRLRRRLGFGAGRQGEPVVVLQATRLNTALPTLIIVPLDPDVDVYGDNPLAIPVGPAECGSPRPHVALPSQLRAVRRDLLGAARVGQLTPHTLGALTHVVRLVLGT